MKTSNKLKGILLNLSEGKDECYVDFESVGKIKSHILAVDFSGSPELILIKVRFCQKLEIERTEQVPHGGFGGDPGQMDDIKVKRDYIEDWININYIKPV